MNARLLISSLLLTAAATNAFAQKPAPPVIAVPVPARPVVKPAQPAPAPSTPAPVTVPTGPEPTGVYGWIAILDPQTNQPWLPYDNEQNPPVVFGYPSGINVNFIRSDGGEQRSVSLGGGEALSTDTQRGAWKYSVRFNHSATMTGPPSVDTTPGVVRYNPAQWRFLNATVSEYRWSVLGRGSTTVLWSVPFTPRATPFDWPVTP